MNQQIKTFLIVIAAIFIAGASLLYGALTPETPAPAPAKTQKPTQTLVQKTPTPKPIKKLTLEEKLKYELENIIGILTSKYPKIATDYTVINTKLYKDGQWFSALLQYRGGDTINRDTLRVLMQKKDSTWIVRTEPPEISLSVKKYPDVPKDILKSINQPVSLP